MSLLNMFKRADINVGVDEFRNTQGAVLLDVRTKEEYKDGHILRQLLKKQDTSKSQPYSCRLQRTKRNTQSCGSRLLASLEIPQKIFSTLQKARMQSGLICMTVWQKKLTKKASTIWQNNSAALLQLRKLMRSVTAHFLIMWKQRLYLKNPE